MEDLTGQHPAGLVPSSMGAGNTTAPDLANTMAMTAPGSQTIDAMPPDDQADQLGALAANNLGPAQDYRRLVHGAGDGGGGTWAPAASGDWPAG